MSDPENLVGEIEALGAKMVEAEASISKRFIGQKKVIDLVLSTLVCGGHGLLIGLPGLGKTRLVETLGRQPTHPICAVAGDARKDRDHRWSSASAARALPCVGHAKPD